MNDSELNEAILAAHAVQDGKRLAALYRLASDRKNEAGDLEAALFLLSQAYVFALESGDESAVSIHSTLMAANRES